MKNKINTLSTNLYINELKFFNIIFILSLIILVFEFNYFYNELIILSFSLFNFFFYFIFSNLYQYVLTKIYFIITLTIFNIIPISLLTLKWYLQPILYQYQWKKLTIFIRKTIKLYWLGYLYQFLLIIFIINIFSSIIINQQLSIILELNPITLINYLINYTYLYILCYLIVTVLFLIIKHINNTQWIVILKKQYYLWIIYCFLLIIIPDDFIIFIGISTYVFITIELIILFYLINNIYKTSINGI